MTTIYTDAQGQFQISAIPAGSYKLRASASGFQTTIFPTIYTVASGAATPAILSLAPAGASIIATGSVWNSQNAAIPGTVIKAYTVSPWTLISTGTYDDASGSFFINVPPNTFFALEILAPGYRSAYSQDIVLTRNTYLTTFIPMTTDEYIALGWPLTAGKAFVRGMVVDTSGIIPLSGVTVSASSTSGSYTVYALNSSQPLQSPALVAGPTANDGIFIIKDAIPGEVLTVTGAKAGKTFLQPVFSHVVANTDSLSLIIETTPPATASISGRVTVGGTNGIANFLVVPCSWNGTNCTTLPGVYTDSNGYFTFPNLAAGQYKVAFIGPPSGYPYQWYNQIFSALAGEASATIINVTTGQEVSAINANYPGGSISGRVIDQSLMGVPVSVSISNTASSAALFSVQTDINGYYSVSGVPNGSYKLTFFGGAHNCTSQFYNAKSTFETADPVTINSMASPAATDINSTLSCTPYPFGIGTTGYATLPEAYAAVGNGGTIKAQTGVVTIGAPPLVLAKSFTFSGGLGTDFSTVNGFTVLAGRTNITAGKVTMKNIKIR